MMELVINGEHRQLSDVHTLDEVIGRLDLAGQERGVAVALNDQVVPKSEWEEKKLSPGDRIEVIRAVQGG
jgi:sulfur carrier protein